MQMGATRACCSDSVPRRSMDQTCLPSSEVLSTDLPTVYPRATSSVNSSCNCTSKGRFYFRPTVTKLYILGTANAIEQLLMNF